LQPDGGGERAKSGGGLRETIYCETAQRGKWWRSGSSQKKENCFEGKGGGGPCCLGKGLKREKDKEDRQSPGGDFFHEDVLFGGGQSEQSRV